MIHTQYKAYTLGKTSYVIHQRIFLSQSWPQKILFHLQHVVGGDFVCMIHTHLENTSKNLPMWFTKEYLSPSFPAMPQNVCMGSWDYHHTQPAGLRTRGRVGWWYRTVMMMESLLLVEDYCISSRSGGLYIEICLSFFTLWLDHYSKPRTCSRSQSQHLAMRFFVLHFVVKSCSH